MDEMAGSPGAEPSGTPGSIHEERGHPALVTGLYSGSLLVIVMLGSLVAANRVPGLERYALERNAASYSLFVLFMLIPVFRFLDRPGKLFASAMIGWMLFILAYDIAGMVFHSLFEALRTPFQAMVEGAVIYGVIAVGSWVGGMILEARRHPIAPTRQRRREISSDER
ncbi:MAG TPA: hypothetical protein VJR26_13115 [Candidatus Acidoferrales bacterium]|nr:hypothetical protein [Candidatus Acidoferrales bacterium]